MSSMRNSHKFKCPTTPAPTPAFADVVWQCGEKGMG